MAHRPILPPIPHSLDGGKKADVDWERAEPYFTPNLKLTAQEVISQLREARAELQWAEDNDLDKLAKKIRSRVNALQEAEIAFPRTWCPTCLNVLHRCKCLLDPTVSRSTNYRRKKKTEWAREYLAESLGMAEEARLAKIAQGRQDRKDEERRIRREKRKGLK